MASSRVPLVLERTATCCSTVIWARCRRFCSSSLARATAIRVKAHGTARAGTKMRKLMASWLSNMLATISAVSPTAP